MSVESSDSKNPALNLSMNVDAGQVEHKLRDFVRGTVEETLNAMLDAEADTLCGAKRYERSEDRVDTRAGHYERELQTQAGSVTLKVPKLRKLNFETDIIERLNAVKHRSKRPWWSCIWPVYRCAELKILPRRFGVPA